MAKIALGSSREATQPDCIRALVIEFVVTFLFVFSSVGVSMTAEALAANALVGLFAGAVTTAFVVAVMIPAGHISGGHLNPAVTLGLLFGGQITVFRSILYMIDQLLASAAACFLLQYLTGGLATPIHALGSGVGHLQGLVWEIVLTFSLLFTIYATMVDPKKGTHGAQGPILVALVVGANIMAGGAFSGASMNPARSFGPALASWDWTNHWVYWVGPLVGGGLAALVYDNFFICRSHVILPTAEEAY